MEEQTITEGAVLKSMNENDKTLLSPEMVNICKHLQNREANIPSVSGIKEVLPSNVSLSEVVSAFTAGLILVKILNGTAFVAHTLSNVRLFR